MRRLVPLAVVAALVAAPVVPALASDSGPGVDCHLVIGEGPSLGEGLPGLPNPHWECW